MSDTTIDKEQNEPARDHSSETPKHLKGRLGTGGLVLIAVALAAPLSLMAGFIPVDLALGLGAATPLVFLATMLIVGVFAGGLLAMANHMRQPGAFYTYIAAGLGRTWGLGAGFVAVVGYLLVAGSTYVFIGVLTQQLVTGIFHGSAVTWWIWGLIAWVIVSGLSMLNINISTRVLATFILAELLIVLFWDLRVFWDGGPEGRAIDVTAQLGTGSIGVAFLFSVATLTGFESIQVFRAETRNPIKTVPRASYLTIATLACFYALGSWAYLVAYGTDGAIKTAATPAAGFMGALAQYAGTAVADVANVLLVTSTVASLLALQNISARYAYSLGRDGVLPKRLGHVHPRHGAPTYAAASIAAITLAIIVLLIILPIDVVTAYVAAAGLGIWALVLLTGATAVAVFVFFRLNPGLETSRWKTIYSPVLAIVAFAYVCYQATTNAAVLMAGSVPIATWCIVAILAVGAVGVAYGSWLRVNKNDVWQRIGNQF